jgi:hypothetical protein
VKGVEKVDEPDSYQRILSYKGNAGGPTNLKVHAVSLAIHNTEAVFGLSGRGILARYSRGNFSKRSSQPTVSGDVDNLGGHLPQKPAFQASR